MDKTAWTEAHIANGNWDAIRAFCRGRQRKQGRLQNIAGKLVESNKRADTMAEFLEKVQWKVRPAEIISQEPLGPTLPVNDGEFSIQEVGKVVQKLKWDKAGGPDGIPAEYWKAVAQTPGGLQWLTKLCNACWLE